MKTALSSSWKTLNGQGRKPLIIPNWHDCTCDRGKHSAFQPNLVDIKPEWHSSRCVQMCGKVWKCSGRLDLQPWSHLPHQPDQSNKQLWVWLKFEIVTFWVTPSILSSPPRTTRPGTFRIFICTKLFAPLPFRQRWIKSPKIQNCLAWISGSFKLSGRVYQLTLKLSAGPSNTVFWTS